MLYQKFHDPRVVRKNIRGPRFNFSEHSRMEVLDGVRHAAMFSYLRTLFKPGSGKPPRLRPLTYGAVTWIFPGNHRLGILAVGA